MKQVKGSIVITIVKAIKTSPKGWSEYNKLLSKKAKEFLKRRILIASWYPLEDYRACFDTLCFVETRNDEKIIVGWGKMEAKRQFSSTYQSSVFKENFQLAIEKFSRFHRRAFNFGEIITNIISDNEIEFIYEDIPRDWEPWYYSSVGWAISFIELCVEKRVSYTFLNKSWKENGWTKVRFTWDS